MNLKDVQHLKLGNMKLPKTTAIFDIMADKTCPGKTAWCRQFCYAKKAERVYPQVLPFRQRNFKLTQSDKFIETITNELKTLVEKKGVTTVRPHSSGDFYSQKYLDDWMVIMEKFPEIIFYAYTKSWHLNFSQRPENFIVFYSIDGTTKRTNPTIMNIAETKHYPEPTGKEKGKLCWDFNKKTNGKCTQCNYCYTKGNNKRVTFFVH